MELEGVTGGVAGGVIGAAIEVHRRLGPGLLEATYEGCPAVELARRGVRFDRQVAFALDYKGVRIENAFRADLFVEGSVIVELKAVEALAPVHVAQLLTYLKASTSPVGLLINFNVPHLRTGIRRVVLNPPPPSPTSAVLRSPCCSRSSQ